MNCKTFVGRNFFLLFLLLFAVSCQRPIYDEAEDTEPTERSLKVSARSSGETSINYPAYIYAFGEDGSCVATQKMTREDPIELQLSPGKYTVVAIADLGEEYVIPAEPSLDDVITMRENNQSSRALMMGASPVTISSSKSSTISITLYYAVSLINVMLEDIPDNIEKVKLKISPLYASLSFDGEYSDKGQSTEVECKRDSKGTWSADPFYIFPGSGSKTTFSITLDDGEQEKTFGYTFNGKPEANVPFNIGGSYSGNVTVEGDLISGEWKDPVDVKFDFGNSEQTEGEDENTPTDPELSGLPEVGSIWKDGIVANVENAGSGKANILLMSLDEWSSKTGKAQSIIDEREAEGWYLPSSDEAHILHDVFGGDALSSVNKTLQGKGYSPLTTEQRYLYDNDDAFWAFGFKSTSQFLVAGTSVKYNIRFVRTEQYVE